MNSLDQEDIDQRGILPPADGDQAKLVTDGGNSTSGRSRRDPTEDPTACSMCGVHIGLFGDEYYPTIRYLCRDCSGGAAGHAD